MLLDALLEPGVDVDVAARHTAQVAPELRPVGRLAVAAQDAELVDRRAVGTGERLRPHDVETVQRERAGDQREQATPVGAGDTEHLEVADGLVLDQHPTTGLHLVDEVAEARVERRRLARPLLAAQRQTGGVGELVDQRRLPRRPRRGPGGAAVGLGEREQQVERVGGADGVGHVLCRARIGQVAARGGLGEQQVVLHERPDDGVSSAGKPMRAGDHVDQLDADIGVVTRIALADVVQQCTDQQQIGAATRPRISSLAFATVCSR
jgi:hypothetical protein